MQDALTILDPPQVVGRVEPPQVVSRVEPRVPLSIRVATAADVPFIDALQKRHGKAVGWFPTRQLMAYVDGGNVLVAEEGVGSCQLIVGSERAATAPLTGPLPTPLPSPLPTDNSQLPTPLGYCISRDRYKGRDEVGAIYQVNVVPGRQRGLVGAALVAAAFERAAYGCRLFGCWCAQDLEANRFWESLGFVPLAFRTGSRSKKRIHIYWQRRVRAGDATTPWWFPSGTNGGAVREDRLVFPIPPGTGWRDVMPVVLPTGDCRVPNEEQKAAPSPRAAPPASTNRQSEIGSRQSPTLAAIVVGGRIKYVKRTAPAATPPPPPVARPQPRRESPKHDPRHVAAARELRDRWLEQVNTDPSRLLSAGKYDVARTLPPPPPADGLALPMLAA